MKTRRWQKVRAGFNADVDASLHLFRRLISSKRSLTKPIDTSQAQQLERRVRAAARPANGVVVNGKCRDGAGRLGQLRHRLSHRSGRTGLCRQ